MAVQEALNGPDVMMRSERSLRIRNDAPPPRMTTRNKLEHEVRQMTKGSWVQVAHERANTVRRMVTKLGGQATVYKTSDLYSVCLVLEAPWALN